MDFGKPKKFFNYRPLVSICLFFIAGVIFATAILTKLTVLIVLATLSIVGLILTIVLKAVYAKKYKIFKIISVILAFLISATISVVLLHVHNVSPNYNGDFYITGRVSERVYLNNENQYVLSLDNVKITNLETLKEEGVSYNVRLYLEEGDGRSADFILGERVAGTFRFTKASIVYKGKLNLYMFNRNIKLIGFGEEDDIVSLNKVNSNMFDKIKIKVKSILDTHMSSEYSELGYTMLFGDKSGLDNKIYSSYSASGIGHLLAVSGLHVGFVVTLFTLILSLFRANNKVKFCVISVALFLYAFACGFSVSVTRAFIMTVVMLFAKCRMKEYDSLSSLSFAALIILITNPMWIFDIGFILSFSAVASIILIAPPIRFRLNKYLGYKTSSAISTSVAVTLGTSLPMMVSFSKLSIFSIVTNVIVIPIASVAYMIMFASVLLALILPALGVFTYMFEFLMKIVTGISSITGSVNFAGFNQILVLIFGVMIVLTAITFSDYLFMNKKSRRIISFSSLCLTIVVCLLVFIC